jgi:hypothetical protein
MYTSLVANSTENRDKYTSVETAGCKVNYRMGWRDEEFEI